MKPRTQSALGYAAIFGASLAAALIAGWLGTGVDNFAYDWVFRLRGASDRQPETAILAIDEASLSQMGGMRHLRRGLGEALEQVAAASPSVVAIDLILADLGDPAENDVLAAAFAKIPRLVLSADIIGDGRDWEEPIEPFLRHAAAVGHVHGPPGPLDGVSRMVPLEQIAGQRRHWALAFEAFRLSRGAPEVTESPEDVQVGNLTVPARREKSRTVRIRYLRPDAEGGSQIPRISLAELKARPERTREFAGKAVFVGWTAQSAYRDRMLTPWSDGSYMPGVEIHANVFETLAGGRFLVDASEGAIALGCVLLAAAGVFGFVLLGGWQAYAVAALVLAAAHYAPYGLFGAGIVFPYVAPLSAAWLSTVGAGSWQFLSVRRALRAAEADRARYQQTLHFVTHEMKTPLTAIQGSSELMTRFTLTDDKRKQMATMINAESKRLARMVETFLNVERLSAGQMELRREPFSAQVLMDACLERARPLAERKRIQMACGQMPEAVIEGDRELMEYAVYNLLNNAVKYSPESSEVKVIGVLENNSLRLAIRDQGIGMEQDEIRKIFQKFYRARTAVASGISGTGIGLSIVEQIVSHHGGRIEVTSAPGKGSCFTLVVPAHAGAALGTADGQPPAGAQSRG
ncbi:MAG TPA: CHASE2 domain-containing protein [Bryobacteraceae bacterium]|nr:CHASE2 domain-containing protein [Bryobacteraceae bacterium]